MSRKSPGSKPKSSSSPAPQKPTIEEQRAVSLLGYITKINQSTLLALHQLGQAPDCQVAKIPALIRFSYTFEKSKFHVQGGLTESQATILSGAANQSLADFNIQALGIAKALAASVTAAAKGLVGAVEAGGVNRAEGQPMNGPEPTLGCCFLNDGTTIPAIPEVLCIQQPDYLLWQPGPCPA